MSASASSPSSHQPLECAHCGDEAVVDEDNIICGSDCDACGAIYCEKCAHEHFSDCFTCTEFFCPECISFVGEGCVCMLCIACLKSARVRCYECGGPAVFCNACKTGGMKGRKTWCSSCYENGPHPPVKRGKVAKEEE